MKVWRTFLLFGVGLFVALVLYSVTYGICPEGEPSQFGVEAVPAPEEVEGLPTPPPPPGSQGLRCSPFQVQWLIRHYEIDVLLIKYYGSGAEAMRDQPEIQQRVRQAVGCERIVTYPDSYVPVIINKDRMAEVQKLLGPEMLPLTPGLEWKPNGRQRSCQASRHRATDCLPDARR